MKIKQNKQQQQQTHQPAFEGPTTFFEYFCCTLLFWISWKQSRAQKQPDSPTYD